MDSIARQAIDLAAELATDAARRHTPAERAEARRLARMMRDPAGKAFTLAMVDRVFRSSDRAAQARQLQRLLRRYGGAPRYLSPLQRLSLAAAGLLAPLMPNAVMPSVEAELRRLTSAVILMSTDPARLAQHIARRRGEGIRVNINQIGEAVLGEAEAQHHLATVLEHLANPGVQYLSVKISSIFSQINIVDFDGTLRVICQRLRTLFGAALRHGGKFITLDMEEYRDLELTTAAFQQVLGEDEFRPLQAGMALQAYIPDSWAAQQRLTEWAKQRVAAGGAPVKVRLVKGANLPVEHVEAELHGWRAAPYGSKTETDANYRRMLEFGCQPENARAVRLGVASHNLFDVALALVLREQHGVEDHVEIEMLEGMANHQARAVEHRAGGLLLYTPIARRGNFLRTIAYLVRRLEENTAPDNFLHDMFALQPGSPAWEDQKQRFVTGWEARSTVSAESRRARLPACFDERDPRFCNASDTDWTQQRCRDALADAMRRWQMPSPPAHGDLNDVLSAAGTAQRAWSDLGHAGRSAVLRRCADVMEHGRFDTIVQMMREAKKLAGEADIEISEAIDFARYIASTPPIPKDVRATPLGTVAVVPPWNFPYSIPAGGVLAALMAGNAVVLKPAPETVATAWRLAQQLWEGGVPRDVLHFFPAEDGPVGQALITDPRVAAVVLTGSYDTARMFLRWRPSLRLMAETSGKNAIVITAQADRDLAIRDLVRSAFGHAGQKCSAASLAILEAEVYADAEFRRMLRDAAASLKVGPATDLGSMVTPLIRRPEAALQRALTTLDPGEDWLLEPRVSQDDPCLWSPGIKLGVEPGSWFHQTECFGPVLGVMRAENLDQAIEFQNATPFGLTGGIHSLDEREIARWRQRVMVGNAYVNRSITGAIVQRQPFGGWKRSSVGAGAKAGGPEYVAQFMRLADAGPSLSGESFEGWWRDYFSREHDPSNLRSESNVLRYRPARGVLLRLEHEDRAAIEWAGKAAQVCGVPLYTSIADNESDAALIARLGDLAKHVEFLRTTQPPSDALLDAAYNAGINWIDAPLLSHGRYELPRWLRQQAVSRIRHRYGLVENAAPMQGDSM